MSPNTLIPPAPHRRIRVATSIQVDRERFCDYFWRRRLNLSSVGPMIGRSEAWAGAMAYKGRAGLYALDELATELNVNLDELLYQIGSDAERARINVL